jgi:dCMP deaminase
MQYKTRPRIPENYDIHRRWLDEARRYSDCSPDPSTKVGAIITDYKGRKQLSAGYNNFPTGVLHKPERWEIREEKYKYVLHAEAMAILRSSIARLTGARLYTTLCPCNECTKLIVQCGFSAVFYPPYEERHWDGLKLRETFNMLQESGTRVECIDLE